MAVLAGLWVADPAALWSELGFDVDGTGCRVGTVQVSFGPDPAGPAPRGAGTGITGWSLAGCDPPPGWSGDLDGLSTRLGEPADPGCPPGGHPNGVVSIDHVVVTTPDLERTVATLGALGILERRRRPAGPETTQVFFRVGEVVLELVGPDAPGGTGPASFWGLAFTVSDLEVTAGLLGPRLRPLKPAVQPGRFIATLDRAAGSSVEMAFLSSGGRP